jgi:hypothetical protein
MSPKDLEASWKSLNADYVKLGSWKWSEFARDLSDAVWTAFQHENTYDLDMISSVARSIVFWDVEKKFYAFGRLWQAAYHSEDITMQNRLCSIIDAVRPGLDQRRLKTTLFGIDQLDRKKHYGSAMASLIRAMEYV